MATAVQLVFEYLDICGVAGLHLVDGVVQYFLHLHMRTFVLVPDAMSCTAGKQCHLLQYSAHDAMCRMPHQMV